MSEANVELCRGCQLKGVGKLASDQLAASFFEEVLESIWHQIAGILQLKTSLGLGKRVHFVILITREGLGRVSRG